MAALSHAQAVAQDISYANLAHTVVPVDAVKGMRYMLQMSSGGSTEWLTAAASLDAYLYQWGLYYNNFQKVLHKLADGERQTVHAKMKAVAFRIRTLKVSLMDVLAKSMCLHIHCFLQLLI